MTRVAPVHIAVQDNISGFLIETDNIMNYLKLNFGNKYDETPNLLKTTVLSGTIMNVTREIFSFKFMEWRN
ncbi:hypothetical protein FHS85_003896 [Rhodoligotrophos appendicifer]|uniref:hypothetical protein n=1 Tax=Rhodoligotrophos appendicifer TaxID=987056 RepID=UPI001186692F|nr:hypothetical protein [Rhodoligotrophos appendicifer]